MRNGFPALHGTGRIPGVPGSGARVEFAIKLPGRRDDGAPLWAAPPLVARGPATAAAV